MRYKATFFKSPLALSCLFLSVGFTWSTREIPSITAPDQLVDMAVPVEGEFAGYPWIAVITGNEAALIWIPDPDAPVVEPIDGKPLMLFEGMTGDIMCVRQAAESIYFQDIMSRDSLSGWTTVTRYPPNTDCFWDIAYGHSTEFQSITRNPDAGCYSMYYLHALEYSYGGWITSYTCGLCRVDLDPTSWSIRSISVLDSFNYYRRSGVSVGGDFFPSTECVVFKYEYSEVDRRDGFFEEKTVPQIELASSSNADPSTPLSDFSLLDDKPGVGWIAAWEQDGRYWLKTHGGSYRMLDVPPVDLVVQNESTAGAIYIDDALFFIASTNGIWNQPVRLTTGGTIDARICSDATSFWVLHNTAQTLCLTRSEAFPSTPTPSQPAADRKAAHHRDAGNMLRLTTPTPTPTQPCGPSPTCVNTPISTVTPDPAPSCDTTGAFLSIADGDLAAGDALSVDLTICNNTGTALPQSSVFCLLEVNGAYFFYPSWAGSLDCITIPVRQGVTSISLIPPVSWPENAGSGQACLWAALTDPEMTQLVGVYDCRTIVWS